MGLSTRNRLTYAHEIKTDYICCNHCNSVGLFHCAAIVLTRNFNFMEDREMKTDLDGKLPKWVIWILVAYAYTVLGSFCIAFVILCFLPPAVVTALLGGNECYIAECIILAITIPAFVVYCVLFPEKTTKHNYTRQARRQAKEKLAIEVPDVPQKPDVEPKKEITKPKNERPFTCTWGEVVLAVTFIGTMAIVFILWDFFVGIYRLKIGSVAIPIISMDLFIGAFLLALKSAFAVKFFAFRFHFYTSAT